MARTKHAKSIKNASTYEAMVRGGMAKGKAARISNGLLKHGTKKGRHQSAKRGRKKK